MQIELEKKLEGKLRSAIASVYTWEAQHERYRDAPSYRCYREALLRALTVAQILKDLGIEGAEEHEKFIESKLDTVPSPDRT